MRNDGDIEYRLLRLEKKACGEGGPGTILARHVDEKGFGWTLALGLLQQPKELIIYASSIQECLDKAEKAMFKGGIDDIR